MTATLPPPVRKNTGRPPRDALGFDLVRDEPGFLALAPFWDNLLDLAATRSPFLRWDWMRLWWEECRGSSRLAVGVLRDAAGLPQAIAPLMLAGENDGARRHLTALGFLSGFGAGHGERLDFIVPAGREEELTPRLCQAFQELRSECDVVRLNFLPEESPNTPHIRAALEQHFVRACVLNRSASHLVTLPGTWEEIEMRHSSSWRGSLRRNVRHLAAQHRGVATVSGAGMLHARAFDEFLQLHEANYPAGVSTFATPATLAFHQRLAEKWLPSGRALMPLLHADGKMMAAVYSFIDRGECFHYQMGWDAAHARLSPGRMALRWALICAMRHGARLYDLQPGDYEYKRQWGDSTRWVLDLEAQNPASWRATTFHALRAMRRRFATTQTPEGHTS